MEKNRRKFLQIASLSAITLSSSSNLFADDKIIASEDLYITKKDYEHYINL